MPAKFDYESSDAGDIPHTTNKKQSHTKSHTMQQVEDDDAQDGEYVVDKIESHKFVKGQVLYKVAWVGYLGEDTWEPLENLDSCPDELAAYHEQIGGPPEPAPAPVKKKPGRPSGASSVVSSKKRKPSTDIDTPEPKASRGPPTKKGKQLDDTDTVTAQDGTELKLPVGTWEHDIIRVENVRESADSNSGGKGRVLEALIEWSPEFKSRKTLHRTKVLFSKAPQKLLEFYEANLIFNITVPVADKAHAKCQCHARNGGDDGSSNANEDVEGVKDVFMDNEGDEDD